MKKVFFLIRTVTAKPESYLYFRIRFLLYSKIVNRKGHLIYDLVHKQKMIKTEFCGLNGLCSRE